MASSDHFSDPREKKDKEDIWTAEAYGQKVAPFVPLLTTDIVSWLDPQPTDHILDIGSGDSVLTARLAPHCASITGVDASANLIAASKQRFPNIPVHLFDCRDLPLATNSNTPPFLRPGIYTKLFSNAALHWILNCPPATRSAFFAGCFHLLAPGGCFAAECGALGNVAEVHAAIIAQLVAKGGVSARKAREASPWWFGAEEEYRKLVEGCGLVWVRGEVVLRQTVLTDDSEEGGLRGWVELFGKPFKKALDGEGVEGDGKKEEMWKAVVDGVVECLEGVGRREWDGGFQINYVRMRFLARKPEA